MYDKRLHKVNYKTEFLSDAYDKVYYAELDDEVGYVKKAYLEIMTTNGESFKFYGITKMGYWYHEDYSEGLNYMTISSITIPNSVTVMEDGALVGVSRIKHLTVPASVKQFGSETEYGSGMFIIDDSESYSELRTVEFLGDDTKLGSYCFNNCYYLSSVTLPSNITEIPYSCFQDCTSLTTIELPSSLQVIKQEAFQHTGLRTIVIPETVTMIDGDVFYDCSNLTAIYYKGSAIDKYDNLWGATNATLITVF